jgi:hypothetical protein
LSDPLLAPALKAFFDKLAAEYTHSLLNAVRQSIRDTMKEARLAGKAEAYEEAMKELQRFAEEQLQKAAQ